MFPSVSFTRSLDDRENAVKARGAWASRRAPPPIQAVPGSLLAGDLYPLTGIDRAPGIGRLVGDIAGDLGQLGTLDLHIEARTAQLVCGQRAVLAPHAGHEDAAVVRAV